MTTEQAKPIVFRHQVWIDEDGEIFFYHQLEEHYEEFLDEIYEPVKICGYERYQGDILRQIDPIMFREGLLEWIDEMTSEHGWTEEYLSYEEQEYHRAKVKAGIWERSEEEAE